MAHVNRLAIFMERLKDQGVDLLPGVLKHVSQSRVELIQACLSHIRALAEYLKLHQQEKGYKAIIEHITPFLTELVDHEEPDIRDMARSKLGEIAELMTEADRSNYVLKVCLELVQEQQRDQNKIAGLKLLGQLASLFSREFVQGYIVTQLTALSHDANDNVRVQTVEQMAKICSLIDKEVIMRKFAPEFKRLSQDQNWQVRLNFVEKLVVLAENLPVDKRNGALGEILFQLLNDKTRWVKEAALQQLGHYLAILDNKNKNDKLFEEYLKIPKSISKLTKEPQTKICLSVAETLPKIIEAQGESTWRPLSGLYKLLLEKDEEIKIILAKNIHALSKCLTKSENRNQLLTVMKKEFLSNNVKGSIT
jgi:hypothetical protein